MFPLGMYTARSVRLAQVLDRPFLLIIPQTSIYIALVGWALAMLGLAHQLTLRAR